MKTAFHLLLILFRLNLSLKIVMDIGVAAKVIILSGGAYMLLQISNKAVFPIPLGPHI